MWWNFDLYRVLSNLIQSRKNTKNRFYSEKFRLFPGSAGPIYSFYEYFFMHFVEQSFLYRIVYVGKFRSLQGTFKFDLNIFLKSLLTYFWYFDHNFRTINFYELRPCFLESASQNTLENILKSNLRAYLKKFIFWLFGLFWP